MCESVDIRSRDDVKIRGPLNVVKMWKTVSNLLESYVPGEEGEEKGACLEEIPVSEVNSHILYKVIDYCKSYLENSESSEWKQEFFRNVYETKKFEDVKRYHLELADLAIAADYLDIEPLLNNIAEVIANTLRNKSPEEIREEWDFPDDLTSEEKEKIILENRWAFDL